MPRARERSAPASRGAVYVAVARTAAPDHARRGACGPGRGGRGRFTRRLNGWRPGNPDDRLGVYVQHVRLDRLYDDGISIACSRCPSPRLAPSCRALRPGAGAPPHENRSPAIGSRRALSLADFKDVLRRYEFTPEVLFEADSVAIGCPSSRSGAAAPPSTKPAGTPRRGHGAPGPPEVATRLRSAPNIVEPAALDLPLDDRGHRRRAPGRPVRGPREPTPWAVATSGTVRRSSRTTVERGTERCRRRPERAEVTTTSASARSSRTGRFCARRSLTRCATRLARDLFRQCCAISSGLRTSGSGPWSGETDRRHRRVGPVRGDHPRLARPTPPVHGRPRRGCRTFDDT